MEQVIFTLLEALDIPKEKYDSLEEEKQEKIKALIIDFFKDVS